MQVAHPKVAAGVAEHSDFPRDPIRRLNRTLDLSLALTFGSEREVATAARRINRTHERVQGDGYRALDPDLLLWVHATLLDSALLSYRCFVSPLSREEAETYYAEGQAIGALLGVPPGHYPPSLPAFHRYVAEMLAGPARPDATGLRLGRMVRRPPIRRVPGALFAPMDLFTVGLLPPPLRQAYGLSWGRARQAAFDAASASVRGLVRALPRRVRLVPQARRTAA